MAEKAAAGKKWKGKDWYAILAPSTFGKKQIGESPSTDIKDISGRVLEVALTSLVPQTQRYYVRLNFKVNRVEGNNAHTRFNGLTVSREQMFRLVRKRFSKVELVNEVETKDGWKLQLTTISALNRSTKSSVQSEVRLLTDKWLKEFSAKSSIEDFVKGVTSGAVQKNIKGLGSKVYPIRFTEITKVEVLKAPAS